MKKIIKALFVFALLIIGSSSVDAASAKLTWVGSWHCNGSQTCFYRKFDIGGSTGYCLQGYKDAPASGKTMQLNRTRTSAEVLCAYDLAQQKGYGYAKTQLAIWYSNSTVPNKTKNNIDSEHKKAAEDIAKVCKGNHSYTNQPSISLTKETDFKLSGSNYVATFKVKADKLNSSGYTCSGTLKGATTTGVKWEKTSTGCQVKVPVTSVNSCSLSANATVKGTGSQKYVEVYRYTTSAQEIVKFGSKNLTVNDTAQTSPINTCGKATVKKVDKATNSTLNGGSFRLYTNNTCTTLAKQISGTTVPASTMKDGQLVFNNLPLPTSTYYVKETAPPDGYDIEDEDNCKAVSINGTLTMKNTKILDNTIQVKKISTYNNDGINGVQIGLYTNSTCTTLAQDAGTNPQTTKNGTVKFGPISFLQGETPKYYVKEIKTPTGYAPEKGEIKCIAVPFSNNKFGTVTIKNIPYGDIKLLKLEGKERTPLEKITFQLLDKDKKAAKDINGNAVANITTDAKGNATFKNIPYGTYYIHEVTQDKHYKANEDVLLELNEDTDSINLAKLSAIPYLVGDINGDLKVDNYDLEELNALIGNQEAVAALDKKVFYSADLNSDGVLTVADVAIMTKYLTPTPQPTEPTTTPTEGENTTTEPTTTPTEGGTTTPVEDPGQKYINMVGKTDSIPAEEVRASVVIINELITIKISKQDIANSQEVPGAQIVIRDNTGKEVLSWISEKEPKEFNLEYGEYTLVETVAPDGYDKLTTEIKFEIKEDGTAKLLSAKSDNYKIEVVNGEEHLIIYDKKTSVPGEEPKQTSVPDTGSVISVAGVISGIVLTAIGGFTIYRRSKKAY